MAKDQGQIGPERRRRNVFLKGLGGASADERRRLLRIEAWVFVIAAYALLLFSYLFPQDFCNTSSLYVWIAWAAFMIRTFAFHFGFVLLVIGAVAAWKRMHRLAAAVVPILLVCVGAEVWSMRPRFQDKALSPTLRVMSVNLLFMNSKTQPIINEIIAADPDVLLLQEYTLEWRDALLRDLKPHYPFIVQHPADDAFGAAVYSKLPIVGQVRTFLDIGSGTEPQYRVVIEHDSRAIAVYNVHLLPPFGLDYIIETRAQFADLLEHLEREQLPFILAGDFNFTERSPQASRLGKLGVHDAQDLGGWGRGTTWPVHGFFRWIPSLRLDHIYLSGEFRCIECRTGIGVGSDHRPVIAEVALAP